MAIVSASTESYVNWLYHFLRSLESTIINEKIIIFLINVKSKTREKLKKKFPNVIFISEEKDLIPKENSIGEVYKVTYLKGEFMEKAFIRFGEPLLWIDCTALIRKSPVDLLDRLESLDVLLMRRDFNKEFGKAVYACEIFGMNNFETIKEYRANCEKRKTEWFADQLALCEIQTKKRDYIKFGEWSNFYYEESASSWSDRGKTGKGFLNKNDYVFTELKFIQDLERRYPGYKKEFEYFFNKKTEKPKILVHIDDSQWCYHTTIKEVTELLKDKYDFLIVEDAKKDFKKYENWEGDLVWARCSSKRHQKLLSIRPDLRKISFSSVTTGGELAEDRITTHLQTNKEEAGIICQNEDVKFRLEYKIEKLGRKQKVFILFNGVNTKKFKPSKKFNQTPVVGFVGRTRTYQEDFIKGFSNILKPVCEKLDLKLIAATNKEAELKQHKDMAEFYNKIDILVLLGNCEGHSNTINEAMASGIPIIAYPVAWHYENAKNQGIIWCNRSTIELLSILSHFKSNFKDYRELGHKNREFTEKVLSWSNVAQYYEGVLDKMIIQAQMHIPGQVDLKVDSKTIGITKIKYIAEDSGMLTQFGLFKPGKEYNLSTEAYNYFKQNFPKKFDFGENE